MEDDKFMQFINCISDAFKNVSAEVSGLNFKEVGREVMSGQKKFSVVIGIVGKNKGRILFEGDNEAIKMITENMNEGPFGNIMDMYFCLTEFTNMFCGNAITILNNKYRGSDLRLTPPAIFAGTEMEISTPSIKSSSSFYKCEHGLAVLDIGFEGE
jgi:CheY-specific phosphatase CheX